MRITRKKAAGLGLALLTAAGLAACSPQLKDQGSVAQANPDYIVTYLNVDGFPNPTVMCIMGAGFITTSRDLSAVQAVPKWDAFCATQQPANPHIIPGSGTTHPVSGH